MCIHLLIAGGRNMCPGRFLARGIITYSMAVLVNDFDVEILTDTVNLGTDRFGIGVNQPTRSIPFRLKRRSPRMCRSSANISEAVGVALRHS
jgi:hypothetical protein